MTDTPETTDQITPDAAPEMTTFAYAEHAPMQTIPLRVGEAIVTVDLVPGRPVELPAGHKVTRALEAARFITLPNPEAGGEPTDGEDTAPEPVRLADQPEGSIDRVRAIARRVDEVPEASLTADGKPRVAAMSPLVGFQVTAAEIDAAVQLEGDNR